MSVRVCVLGSGSRGNCTLVATERARLLIDAGLSCRESYARLAAINEPADGLSAVVISHEHTDHINGLRVLAQNGDLPVYVSRATWEEVSRDEEIRKKITKFEYIAASEKFTIGDIEITPFPVPHDAVDPVAFTLDAQGIRISVVTDLGYIPEIVKQRVKGSHVLIFESNHDLEMLKIGPYPWAVKQRVMGRQGHLSNNATADFLTEEFDGAAQVLVLAHLSETNNHPEIARLSAAQALAQRARLQFTKLHLASQTKPTEVFRF